MKSLENVPNLAERVYRAILDEILDGELKPGEQLFQDQLAADLGVSRQPVQQAIAMLKSDGLVEDIGRRKSAVTGLDLTRMHHYYEARAIVDEFSARAAATAVEQGRVSRQHILRQAEAILTAGASAITTGSVRDQIVHDESFHRLIYDLTGNPALGEVAEPTWRFLRRAMAEVLRYAQPAETIWEQHRSIIAAIASGDPQSAGQRARDHIKRAAEMLASALEIRDAAKETR